MGNTEYAQQTLFIFIYIIYLIMQSYTKYRSNKK